MVRRNFCTYVKIIHTLNVYAYFTNKKLFKKESMFS